jgi:hypothetical protein
MVCVIGSFHVILELVTTDEVKWLVVCRQRSIVLRLRRIVAREDIVHENALSNIRATLFFSSRAKQ